MSASHSRLLEMRKSNRHRVRPVPAIAVNAIFFRQIGRVRSGAENVSKPAEPVVALVLPITASVVVLHPHRGDIFRILEPELGWDADLDRETVSRRQGLVIELERQLRLRV